MWLDNIYYEDREIEDERVEVTDPNGLYFLGPRLVLRRCTVIIRVPARQLHVCPSRFIDCTIEVKRELKNLAWVEAKLQGCRFKGRMTGCDFGPWTDYSEHWREGFIEDCDFTEARLDGCRFHGCDVRTLRLPRWPCFTILEPVRRARELNRVQWPGRFGPVIVEGLSEEPPSASAVTFHAPSVAERQKTTAEELKSVLEKFDFILL
jgi:hypothetical protein